MGLKLEDYYFFSNFALESTEVAINRLVGYPVKTYIR